MPSWNPQQPWPAPVPPPNRGPWKWILGGVALVAVIAVTAVVAVSFDRSSGANNGNGSASAKPSPSGSTSDIASANDTGPVGIITEDPSCAPWEPINNTLAAVERNGWGDRNPAIAAADWTPELRAQYLAVAQAMKNAAEQTIPLIKLTTHRVVRELYDQFIYYARAYAESIPNYVASNNNFAQAAVSAHGIVSDICDAITSGSAAARGPLVPPVDTPSQTAPVGDPSNPVGLMSTPDPICQDLETAVRNFLADLIFKDWIQTNSDLAASQWPPQQLELSKAVGPIITDIANKVEEIGNRSPNPIVQDFLTLSAQYYRAYVITLPTYMPSDKPLYFVGQYTPGLVRSACGLAPTN
ncbi:hypothetical protein [Mycobacterium sp. MAA66]|uniref:hypothetical protein n=1 Tax=Mycobacterium sp. MAA66 TaxID=3156297 RepID=UPI00351319AC